MAGRNLFAEQENRQNNTGLGRNLLAQPDEIAPVETPSEPIPEERPMNPAQMVEAGADVAKVMATGAFAEPVAGIAGLADQMRFNPMPADPLAAMRSGNFSLLRETTPIERAKTVGTTKSLLTASPSTEGGRNALLSMSNYVEPVAVQLQRARDAAGDKTLQLTNSPLLASVASTAPDAAIEGLGMLTGGLLSRGTRATARTPFKSLLDSKLKTVAPDESMLKSSADRLFKSVDDMGVTVKAEPFQGLVDNLESTMLRQGADPQVTPAAWGVLDRLKRDADRPLTLGEIETVREVAKGAAASTNAREAMLGTMAVEGIDNFLEALEPGQLITGKANAELVGETYRQARNQWGRYRRAEALTEAVDIAATSRSGWENGIRQEFTKLHKRIVSGKEKGYKPQEIEAIKRVADGTAGANIFRELGKAGLGFGNLGQNWLGAFLTGGLAGSVGGPWAALAAVGAGTGAKKLAQRMTRGNADFANAVVRAGDKGQDIVEAYMRFTPKAQRSADELSALLIHQDVDLAPLKRFRLEREAADLAAKRRSELIALLAAGEAKGEQPN